MLRLLWFLFKCFVVLVALGIVFSLFMGGIGLLFGLIKPIIIILVIIFILRLIFGR